MQKGERGNIRISKPLDEFGNPIGTLDIQPTFKLDGQIVKPRVENNQYFHVGIANNSKGREVAIRAKKDGRAVLTIEIPGQEAITINLVSGNPDAVVPEISLQSKAAESEWAALVQPWVIEEGEGQYSIKASVPEGTQGTFAWTVPTSSEQIIRTVSMENGVYTFEPIKAGRADVKVALDGNSAVETKTITIDVRAKEGPMIKLNNKVGDELQPFTDSLNLKYDFGKKVHVIKAVPTNNESVRWQVAYTSSKGIEPQKNSPDDELHFKIKKMGSYKVVVYAGSLNKECWCSGYSEQAPKGGA